MQSVLRPDLSDFDLCHAGLFRRCIFEAREPGFPGSGCGPSRVAVVTSDVRCVRRARPPVANFRR